MDNAPARLGPPSVDGSARSVDDAAPEGMVIAPPPNETGGGSDARKKRLATVRRILHFLDPFDVLDEREFRISVDKLSKLNAKGGISELTDDGMLALKQATETRLVDLLDAAAGRARSKGRTAINSADVKHASTMLP